MNPTEGARPAEAGAAEAGAMDLVEIYYAPAAVYRRRADGAEFGLPIAVLAIAMTALYYATLPAMQPVMDAEWARMAPAILKKLPPAQATPERLQAMQAIGAKWAGIGVFFGAGLVGPLVTGLLLWLVARIVGVTITVGRATMIAVFAFFPLIVEQLVNAGQALVLPEGAITSRYSLSLGPARFLDPGSTSPVTMAVIGHIDLFTIWMALLLAIGLRVVARASTAQAATAGIAVWIIGLLPTLLGALRAG